jgi:hypothetical protein
MSNARPRTPPDEGLLDKTNVAQLLAEAWAARRSGRLRLARGKSECWIQVVDGAPVSVEARPESDRFARALEAAGRLDGADRRKLEQFARERECSQASAALALKLVDPAALYQAIRAEAKQQIAETFEWQSGRLSVERRDAAAGECEAPRRPEPDPDAAAAALGQRALVRRGARDRRRPCRRRAASAPGRAEARRGRPDRGGGRAAPRRHAPPRPDPRRGRR